MKRTNNYSPADHSFVICAYKESPFLEQCIESLKSQNVRSSVLMATSTPNDHIKTLAGKYGIPLFVNGAEPCIAGDWNFALRCADTGLVTLAHQDDVYLPNYTEVMLSSVNRVSMPLIFASNYGEIRNGNPVFSSRLINVKKIMSFPIWLAPGSEASKHFVLAFGNGICCPTVTYNAAVIKEHPFSVGMSSNLDWEKWMELSKMKGSFVYSRRQLMLHRLHADAETTKLVNSNRRQLEDYEIFKKIWPNPIATVLAWIYSRGERTYRKL